MNDMDVVVISTIIVGVLGLSSIIAMILMSGHLIRAAGVNIRSHERVMVRRDDMVTQLIEKMGADPSRMAELHSAERMEQATLNAHIEERSQKDKATIPVPITHEYEATDYPEFATNS